MSDYAIIRNALIACNYSPDYARKMARKLARRADPIEALNRHLRGE